jgi:hypothetical protein
MIFRLNCLMPAMAAATLAFGATTATWEMNSYNDFLKGKFSNVALSRDGRLSLAPKLDSIFSSDQPEIWTLANAPDGAVYIGTGHRGRVYKVDQGGRASLVWSSEQPEVFALAVDGRGTVFAGTSPDGKVYRIENGKAQEFFAPGCRYIWSLAVGPDGSLYVGTGDQGKIFRVRSDGKSEVYFDSGQTHITSLALDPQGRLLAGSEPNGILYRLTGPNKAFVLYDANLPEIRSIVPVADGTVYIAALGGSTSKRSGTLYGTGTGTGGPVVSAPATSVTVTDSNAQSGPEIKPPKPEQPKATANVTSTVQPVQAAAGFDVSGVDKSAIYRILPDNTVETVWSSKEENVYDIAAVENRILFSTDLQGRIYRLTPDRKATLLAQTGESEATRLMIAQSGLLAATGNMGKLYRLTGNSAPDGYFESPVHDSTTVARWGRLSWRGDLPQGTQIAFRTRTGNSARPDSTWSDWSAPITSPTQAAITSPNARYIQWRVELRSSNGNTPALDSVTAAYLPQNTPPVVRSISVSSQPNAAAQKAAAAVSAAASTAFSITVTDSGEATAAAGTPTQTLNRGAGQQTQISWQADDPDGDRLVYSVYFRGEDEREWKLLRSNLFENTLNLDAEVLADGRYYFRVVASDRPSNPQPQARENDLISAPVLIDNTPPLIRVTSSRRAESSFELTIDASDQTSTLRRCEYSIDAGPWSPVEASDGVTDSAAETFHIQIDNLRAGEHLIVIRVYDAAGNAGLAKIVTR